MNQQTDLRRKYPKPCCILSFVAFVVWSALGPFGLETQVRTRAEESEQTRREKVAGLWPERESPLVRQVNALVKRGLSEGIESGRREWTITIPARTRAKTIGMKSSMPGRPAKRFRTS